MNPIKVAIACFKERAAALRMVDEVFTNLVPDPESLRIAILQDRRLRKETRNVTQQYRELYKRASVLDLAGQYVEEVEIRSAAWARIYPEYLYQARPIIQKKIDDRYLFG